MGTPIEQFLPAPLERVHDRTFVRETIDKRIAVYQAERRKTSDVVRRRIIALLIDELLDLRKALLGLGPARRS